MLLNLNDIIHMLSIPTVDCPECGQPTCQNYCRQCDEFYRNGHRSTCSQFGEHSGHRIYPSMPLVPFSSDTCDWAIHLDVMREKHVWIEHAAVQSMFGEPIGSRAYMETFLDMGDRALAWAEKFPLSDGKVYAMHFANHDLDLRIGVIGGQLMLFLPKPEIEHALSKS